MADFVSPYKVRRKTFTVVKEPGDPPEVEQITGAAAAAAHLLPLFRVADAGVEHFACILVDQRHRPLGAKILFSGALAETPVYPREIARQALLINAAGVVVAHSHPSNDLTPSREDIQVTERIRAALSLLQIRLLDHLVIAPSTGAFRSILN